MLDDSSEGKEKLDEIKKKLSDLMHYKDNDMLEEFIRRFGEEPPQIVIETLKKIGCPYSRMQEISELVKHIIEQIEDILIEKGKEH